MLGFRLLDRCAEILLEWFVNFENLNPHLGKHSASTMGVGWKVTSGDFACSCVRACVLLLSRFDFDFDVWILPLQKGRDAIFGDIACSFVCACVLLRATPLARDMLAKCRRCGDVWRILIEGSLVGRGEGKGMILGILRAPVCVRACVLLLSHFDFDFEVWILPLPKG